MEYFIKFKSEICTLEIWNPGCRPWFYRRGCSVFRAVNMGWICRVDRTRLSIFTDWAEKSQFEKSLASMGWLARVTD